MNEKKHKNQTYGGKNMKNQSQHVFKIIVDGQTWIDDSSKTLQEAVENAIATFGPACTVEQIY